MKAYRHYIPFITIVAVHYLLAHLHVFFDGYNATMVYLVRLRVYPIILLFVMFKYSDSFKKIQRNVASNILFYVFWGDFTFFSIKAVLIHLEKLGNPKYFETSYYPFLAVLIILSILAYLYRNKLDFNRLKSDPYDKLGCYVIAEYPKEWYEFIWSLIYGIPASKFGILMNGYVYTYTDKLNRSKVQDVNRYKLRRVKVNKETLKERLNGYENLSLLTHNCKFIKDVMGQAVQYYYK
jgi:hypothetical protein